MGVPGAARSRGFTGRLVSVAVLLATTFAVPAASHAAEAASAGWWTRAPVPLAPDAEGSLLVQGGPQRAEPTAYAAVSFVLAAGERPVQLEIAVTGGSASTPATLDLCPVTSMVSDARGGGASEGPAFDCTTKVSAGPVDGAYRFDVSAMAQPGTFAAAIVPTTPFDRVVLARPTSRSLETTFDRGGTGAVEAGSTGSTASAFGGSSGTLRGSGTFDIPDTVLGGDASGPADAPDPVPVSEAADPQTPERGGGGGGGNGDGEARHDTRWKGPLLVLLLLVAGGLWAGAGRMTGEQRPPSVSARHVRSRHDSGLDAS